MESVIGKGTARCCLSCWNCILTGITDLMIMAAGGINCGPLEKNPQSAKGYIQALSEE